MCASERECVLLAWRVVNFYVHIIIFCKNAFWMVWTLNVRWICILYNHICASFYKCRGNASYAPTSEKCRGEAFWLCLLVRKKGTKKENMSRVWHEQQPLFLLLCRRRMRMKLRATAASSARWRRAAADGKKTSEWCKLLKFFTLPHSFALILWGFTPTRCL